MLLYFLSVIFTSFLSVRAVGYNMTMFLQFIWVKYIYGFLPCVKSVQLRSFFLVRIFPHSDWIQKVTEYLFVFSPNAGKYGQEKTPYLDTFHAVLDIHQFFVYKVFSFLWSTIGTNMEDDILSGFLST